MPQLEVDPISIAQLRQLRNGQWITLEPEWGTIAQDLREINPEFVLRCDPQRSAFAVVQVRGEGFDRKENIVTTAEECDQRLVRKVRRIVHGSYDLLAEMEKAETQEKRDADHARKERTGEFGEKLLHAMQKDLGVQNVVYLSDEVGKRRRRKGLK